VPFQVIWIVGEPGVGKTTHARRLLSEYGPVTNTVTNPKWTEFGLDAAAVGHWTGGTFDGGDTVPIGQIKPALLYYAEHYSRRPLVIFDGDKFANLNAVRSVAENTSARLVCVHLIGEEAAAGGRELRGSKQNIAWVKGRRTKARNFAAAFDQYGTVMEIPR